MIIAGIDPGFGRFGYAFIEKRGGALRLLDAGTIETNASLAHEKRLHHIYTDISGRIRRWKPAVLSIEKIFFASNQKTAIPVAEARGIALLTAVQGGLTVYEYTPPQMKRAVCGDGRADKKAVQKMVALTLRLAPSERYDDTTDAIALAITAAYDRTRAFSSSKGELDD